MNLERTMLREKKMKIPDGASVENPYNVLWNEILSKRNTIITISLTIPS